MTDRSITGSPAAPSWPDRTPLITLPERFPGRVVGAVGLLFAVAYGASLVLLPKPGGRLVMGDALHHYVQLRSAVFDGDLHFRNEYERLYGLRGSEPGTEWVYQNTETGHTRNLMPVGPALLWAPAFLVMTAAVWAVNAAGGSYPLDGYATLFQATAGFSGIAAATLGVWLTFVAAAGLVDRRAAIWAALVMWLSSSALYYSLVSPTYSHAPSLLAVSAFWLAFLHWRGRVSTARYAGLGALAGVCALMRWQDAIVLVIPAIDLLHRAASRTLPLARAAGYGAAAAAAAFAAFTPQMIVWQTLYGRPLAIPQGAGFMRWGDPALLQVLFSDYHGLLTWTPIVAAGIGGLALLARRDRLAAAGAAAFFLLSWYVNAAAADWWAGEAFGARRFVSGFPLFTLGLGLVLDRWGPSTRTLAAASAAVVGYTVLLLIQYQAFMKGLRDVVPYPRGGYDLWLARFEVPFDLLAWWMQR